MKYKIPGKERPMSLFLDDEELHELYNEIIDHNTSKYVEVGQNRSSSENVDLGELDQFGAVMIQYEDGGTWVFSIDDYKEYIANTSHKNRSDDEYITIGPYLNTGNRGANILEQVTEFIAFNPITSFAIKKVVSFIENRLVKKRGMYHIHDKGDNLDREFQSPSEAPEKPYLVMIHGTMSSVNGSFGGIISPTDNGTNPEWKKLLKKYGRDYILGFQHKTFSDSVLTNAIEIIKTIPEGAKIDILCFSRGSLITEALNIFAEQETVKSLFSIRTKIEELIDYANDVGIDIPQEVFDKSFSINKIVRVAGPVAGTSLLGDSIPNFIQAVFKLINKSKITEGSTLFKAVHILATALIKQKDNHKSIPGIKNMVPDDELVDVLKWSHDEYNTPLVAICGIANVCGLFAKSVQFIMGAWVFKGENDLVVDTKSMDQGLNRKVFFTKTISPSNLFHTKYFDIDESREVIMNVLLVENLSTLKLDDRYTTEEKQRGIFDRGKTPKNKEFSELGDRDMVVLIPGILGSTFDEDDGDLLWIHYFNMVGGGLKKLDIRNKDSKIKLSGGDGKSYTKLVEYLQETGYDVMVHPYDWRQGVEEQSKGLTKLMKKLHDLSDDNGVSPRKVHIMAHSMGGLIVREMLLSKEGPSIQEEMKIRSGRIMLLGTPWRGSYLILETFNGMGSRFKQLHFLTKLTHWKKRALMEVLIHFQGVWDLLPLYGDATENLASTWRKMKKISGEVVFGATSNVIKAKIENFQKYRNRVLAEIENIDYDNIYYIAGHSEVTNDVLTIDKEELKFEESKHGDGSVTWDSGIHEKIDRSRVYYTKVGHGSLCNQKQLFSGFRDILIVGQTHSEDFSKSSTFAITEEDRRGLLKNRSTILSTNPKDVIDDILGMDREEEKKSLQTFGKLDIQVVNGDLKYSKYPLLVGHFFRDDIVSAEKVVNALYDNTLSNRNDLGAYPNHLGTSLFVKSDANQLPGAMIIGLGKKNEVNPQRLQYTVEQSIIEYLLNEQILFKKGISSLIIGSGYGDMVMTECLNAIIQGIVNANIRFKDVYPDKDVIESLEIIELYQDKAEQAFEFIHENLSLYANLEVNLSPRVMYAEGRVAFNKYHKESRWWKNITVRRIVKNNKLSPKVQYSVSSKIARVESRSTTVDTVLVDLLMGKIDYDTDWRKDTIQAAFKLLIPKELVMLLTSNNGIVWTVDRYTARYPWELLFYKNLQDQPSSIQAGMIRQLMVKNPKPVVYVNKDTVCVVADPILNQAFQNQNEAYDKMDQLPKAEEEGRLVLEKFRDYNYQFMDMIGKTYDQIFPALLLHKHKVIHIACHGVLSYGPQKQSGIVFDYNAILSAPMLDNLEYMPDFIFVNCCYSGAIDNIQRKNELASNIGVTLIENGVKAVIVGAWQISDSIAKLFCEVFYDNFLNGVKFGEAVRRARQVCYNRDSSNNTWAAYQCYGNQHYTLHKESKEGRSSQNVHYHLRREILRDLEKLGNQIESGRIRSKEDVHKIDDVVKNIERSKLRDGHITERIGRLYAELGHYEQAIQYFKLMKREDDLDYKLWSSHFHKVIESKYSLEQMTTLNLKLSTIDKEMNNLESEIKEINAQNGQTSPNLKLLNSKKSKLNELGFSSKKLRNQIDELVSIIVKNKKDGEEIFESNRTKTNAIMFASLYKTDLMALSMCIQNGSRNLTAKRKKEVNDSLISLSQVYKTSYQYSKEVFDKENMHTLCAGIYVISVAEKGQSAFFDELATVIGQDVLSYLDYKQGQIRFERNMRFWDEIQIINILEAKFALAFHEEFEVVDGLVNEIITVYQKYYDSGGSIRNLMAEIDQINFLMMMNNITNRYSKHQANGLVRLKEYYQALKEKYS